MKVLILIQLISMLIGLASCSLEDKPEFKQKTANDFMYGADLSILKRMNDLGGKYKIDGVEKDALEIFTENGNLGVGTSVNKRNELLEATDNAKHHRGDCREDGILIGLGHFLDVVHTPLDHLHHGQNEGTKRQGTRMVFEAVFESWHDGRVRAFLGSRCEIPGSYRACNRGLTDSDDESVIPQQGEPRVEKGRVHPGIDDCRR